MTPKEKAKELYISYYMNLWFSFEKDRTLNSKQCALMAVELHLEELSKMKLIFSDREIHYNFWQEVKKEIEKL